MEREILFRGKRTYNGEWVEGDLIHLPLGIAILANGYAYIDSDTVGQYTGLKDKNGVKIFEGDILRFNSGNYYVEWCNEHSKYLQRYQQFTRELCICIDNAKVIGNIHDNPELLK